MTISAQDSIKHMFIISQGLPVGIWKPDTVCATIEETKRGEPMIEGWMKEFKKECAPRSLGMILAHNGIVRATAKDGKPVKAMKLSCDKAKLETIIKAFKKKDGIADIQVWINEGVHHIGEDIRGTSAWRAGSGRTCCRCYRNCLQPSRTRLCGRGVTSMTNKPTMVPVKRQGDET